MAERIGMLERLSIWRFTRGLWRIVRGRPQVPPSLADSEILRVLLRRRSVRRFTGRAIPDDVFAAILEAGRLAPCTVNLQTWTFAAFTDSEWRATFGSALPFLGRRAVIIMGDTHRARQVLDAFPESPLVEYTVAVVNASLAAMAMNLAAEALGVSSVMLSETGRSGFLDAGYLCETLGLPPRVVPLMTIVFGYARGPYPAMPPKLPLSALLCPGRYRDADPILMRDWLDQMRAGYKASHPGSSFEAQLSLYRAKIGQAEDALRRQVYGER